MSPPKARSPYRLALLFDVDGTLLLTDGAAREAFSHAVARVLSVEDDLTDVPFAGRTEPLIVADILAKHGRSFGDGEEPMFWNAVFDRMRAIFGPDRGHLLPGVPELLEATEREPAWVQGLLTGNMTEMARIKLARFSIAERFRFGAFGEEAPDRNALARLAVGRVGERYGIPPHRCIVIGDTVHDVECARAAAARAVAVATGSSTLETLERTGPDLLLRDLTLRAPLLAWMRSVAAED